MQLFHLHLRYKTLQSYFKIKIYILLINLIRLSFCFHASYLQFVLNACPVSVLVLLGKGSLVQCRSKYENHNVQFHPCEMKLPDGWKIRSPSNITPSTTLWSQSWVGCINTVEDAMLSSAHLSAPNLSPYWRDHYIMLTRIRMTTGCTWCANLAVVCAGVSVTGVDISA